MHAAAVWGICKVYREQLDAPIAMLLRGTWPAVALLPVMVLLAKEGSAWAAVIPVVLAVTAVLFVRRGAPDAGRSANSRAPAGVASSLFALEEPPPLVRTLLSAVVMAILLEGAAALLLSWQFLLAGLLLAMCAAAVTWKVSLRPRVLAVPGGRTATRRLLLRTGAALLLTVVALLPSMGGSWVSGTANALLRGRGAALPQGSAAPQSPARGPGGGALSGVILTLPPQPQQKTVRSPPAVRVASAATAQRTVLPFDGAYWYFRSPDVRPRPDARTVRGNPLKVQIRSTDPRPLQMEAHQLLAEPLALEDCRAIDVAMQRAWDQPGAIAVELALLDHSRRTVWRQSLGWRVLSAGAGMGAAQGRGPAEEVLRFPVPPEARARVVDELMVVIRPEGAQSRVGAHVAVEHFELEP